MKLLPKKTVLTGKLLVINAYIKKEERSQISNLPSSVTGKKSSPKQAEGEK